MRIYNINNQPVIVKKNSFSRPDKINERTTCTFTAIEPDFEIDIGMQVEVIQDGEIVFAGTVDSIDEYEEGFIQHITISCADFSQLIDKRFIAATYEDTLAGDIAKDFIAQVFHEEGISEGNIQQGALISKAVFNYDNGNVAMNYLTDITGFIWFIDNNKQLHFIERSTNLAPFGLTDNSLNYKDLRVRKTRGNYRNRQYIAAGRDVSLEIAKELPTPKPDGISKTFVVRFPIAEKPTIFINNTALPSEDVGVNGLDTGKKFYFSYASNTITQDFNEPPLTTEEIAITYKGLYPLRVVVDDPSQMQQRQEIEGGSGIYESLVEEPNINSRNTAFEYALGKLEKYGMIPKVVTFTTYEHGLKAGQLINIQNTKRRLNDSFLIEEVTARADGILTMYFVRCLDGSSIGGWEQFFKELIKGQRKLTIRENEVLVLLNSTTERMGWSDDLDIKVFACHVPSEQLYPQGLEWQDLSTQTWNDLGSITWQELQPDNAIYPC